MRLPGLPRNRVATVAVVVLAVGGVMARGGGPPPAGGTSTSQLPAGVPAGAKLLGTAKVPGTSTDTTSVPIGPLLQANTRYYLVASGVVKTWPGNPQGPSQDPAWCFDTPAYCSGEQASPG